MQNKTLIHVMLAILLIFFIALQILGFNWIGKIGMGIISTIVLILVWPRDNKVIKNILSILPINIIPACIMFYVAFTSENTILLYGSCALFFISFPVAFIVLYKLNKIK